MSKTMVIDFTGKLVPQKPVNDQMTLCKCYVMALGKNHNKSNISKEASDDALPSLFNIPVVGHLFVDKNNNRRMGGHDMALEKDEDGNYKFRVLTVPFGVVPQQDDIHYEEVTEKNGTIKTYLVADIILWTGRYPELLEATYSDEVYFAQSMEINPYVTSKSDDGYLDVEKYQYSALCMLGKSDKREENVEPCFEQARIEPYTFSATGEWDRLFGEFKEELSKCYAKQEIGEGGKKALNTEMIKKILAEFGLSEDTALSFEVTEGMTEDELRARVKSTCFEGEPGGEPESGEPGSDNAGDGTDNSGENQTAETGEQNGETQDGENGNTEQQTTGESQDGVNATGGDGDGKGSGTEDGDGSQEGGTTTEGGMTTEGGSQEGGTPAADVTTEETPAPAEPDDTSTGTLRKRKKKEVEVTFSVQLTSNEKRIGLCKALSKLYVCSEEEYTEYYLMDFDDAYVYCNYTHCTADVDEDFTLRIPYVSGESGDMLLDLGAKEPVRQCWLTKSDEDKLAADKAEMAALAAYKQSRIEDDRKKEFASVLGEFSDLGETEEYKQVAKDVLAFESIEALKDKLYSIRGRYAKPAAKKPITQIRIPVGFAAQTNNTELDEFMNKYLPSRQSK